MPIYNDLSDIKKYLKERNIVPIPIGAYFSTLTDVDILDLLEYNKMSFEENRNTKCVLLFHCDGDFLHAESVIVKREQDKYKIVFLTGIESKDCRFGFKNNLKGLEVVYPNQRLSGVLTHPLGNGVNCLETAIYSIQNLDMEQGIVLNGEEGHSVDELQNGDRYITVETAKISRSTKYLEASGIDVKTFRVLNTNNQEQTLERYRETYTVEGRNQFLNFSANFGTGERLMFKRENSLDDINSLNSTFSPNSDANNIVKKMKENILNRF